MKLGIHGPRGDAGLWMGLGRSPFLADLTSRDRDPVRFITTLGGGLGVGVVAAVAAMLLALISDVLLTGRGGRGLAAIGEAAIRLQAASPWRLPNAVLQLVLAASVNGAFALGFVAVAALVAGHPLYNYVTAARNIRWRLVIAGLLMGSVLLAPLVAIDRFWGDDAGPVPLLAIGRGGLDTLVYAAAALLLLPAAAAEEILFRGWLLRLFASVTREPLTLIIGTALLFSALHFDFAPDDFLMRAIMGAGFAYMTLRLGGIELATGAHAANNILLVLFVEPLSLKADEGAGFFVGGAADRGRAVGRRICRDHRGGRPPFAAAPRRRGGGGGDAPPLIPGAPILGRAQPGL